MAALAQAPADEGVIRLRPSGGADREAATSSAPMDTEGLRRGFDYEAFEARLESLWFQRKALIEDGREGDAARQADRIRAICSEEGVRRLEYLAAALVAEASRLIDGGRYETAAASLDLAETFDPGRSQIRLARAHLLWRSGRGWMAAGGELLAGIRASVTGAVNDLTLFSRLGIVLALAGAVTLLAFALLMVVRYQLPFRHEIEEWLSPQAGETWARLAGLGLLFLPLMLWIPAGWIGVYWIAIAFRFMRRTERLTAAALLIAAALTGPTHRLGVSLYGMTVDPLARATLAASGGEYDPERVIKLRRLVDGNPEDPRYRFLLAGLYKSGRYFEEAFHEYQQVLEIDPEMAAAQVNVANIFLITGQHGEAIVNYRKALDIAPESSLAWFNMHLAQSESFGFREAEASLGEARARDPKLVGELLGAVSGGNRSAVRDATLHGASVLEAALRGNSDESADPGRARLGSMGSSLVNPAAVVSVGALLLCCGLAMYGTGHDPARRCIRCGRGFCRYCKSGTEGREYCRQCYHLFVLGDGLAPQARQHKEYEIERFERHGRLSRRVSGWLLPGAGQVLRGAAGRGALLLALWFGALLTCVPAAILPLDRVLGLDLRLDLLRAGAVPAVYALHAAPFLAGVVAVTVWAVANLRRVRRGEA